MSPYFKRKKLRLQGYDYTQGNTVFVTVCVENRKMLLGEILEPDTEGELPTVELSGIGKVVDQFTSTIRGIEKYVVMPNHVHMIVTNAEGEDISAKLRAWKSLITRQIGSSIWQRAFYDHVIRDEEDFRIRWKYIDDNPSKWAMDKYFQR
jgi:REP element-mobilizing transposase RayT